MKNYLYKALSTMFLFSAGTQLYAWTYEFTNHTSHVIAIGMRYQGVNEPLEVRVIKPQEMKRFRPGDPDISEWKRGFVVDKFYYIKNPTLPITDANKLNIPWREFKPTFVPSESYELAIELAEAVGKTTEAAGVTAAKAIGAYMTGGASVAAEAAAKAAEAATAASKAKDAKAAAKASADAQVAAEAAEKLAQRAVNESIKADAKAKVSRATNAATAAADATAAANANAEATKAEADAAAAKAAAYKAQGAAATAIGSGSYGLSGLLKSVGKVAARSMAASRHFDIVEDEKGNINIITLL